MQKTRLSTKGRVIIPKSIRDAHHWFAGLEFTITEVDNSILLTPVIPFELTSVKDVLGCLSYEGRKKTLKQIQKIID